MNIDLFSQYDGHFVCEVTQKVVKDSKCRDVCEAIIKRNR